MLGLFRCLVVFGLTWYLSNNVVTFAGYSFNLNNAMDTAIVVFKDYIN